MDKTKRNYELLVYPSEKPGSAGTGNPILIRLPFTLEIDINRNDMSSVNTASLRIYNLAEDIRNALRKDQYDGGDLRRVVLKAGYGDNLPVVAFANLTQAWSVREGTNYITTLECFDGGYAVQNSTTENMVFPAGTSQKDVVRKLAKNLEKYDVKVGCIGALNGAISSRTKSYDGNTYDVLRQITGGRFFIDNGIMYCLADNEFISNGQTMVISSDSGLLGTPVREGLYFRFDMIFEPRLFPGQLVEMKSLTAKNFNGLCKVISIAHKGTISEAVSGTMITSVGLASGALTGGRFEALFPEATR